MKISVFGLGYVGATSAACFAELGHKVIGVDINRERIDAINEGKSPIPIDKLGKLIKKQIDNKNLYATHSYTKAILNSDISFVCVQTPSKMNGDIDLNPLESACKQIGAILKLKADYHTVVIRSTIFPGTLNKLEKIIEKRSGYNCGKEFGLATNPEFLREKTAVDDFFNPCYIVVGSNNISDAKTVMDCYKSVLCDTRKFIVSPNVAQMIKYVNNSWHACKVTFTNEIGRICEKANINGGDVMSLFCKDRVLNISSEYHRVGKSWDGHCLPKDLSVLQYRAKKFRIKTPLIQSISESNDIQKRRDKK